MIVTTVSEVRTAELSGNLAVTVIDCASSPTFSATVAGETFSSIREGRTSSSLMVKILGVKPYPASSPVTRKVSSPSTTLSS